MNLSGLERAVLEAAADGHVLEEPESAQAVGAAYRHLQQYGLLDADWWGEDALPLMVEITSAGRTLIRFRG